MGSENPTVGIVPSWKRGTLFRYGVNKKREGPDHRIASKIPDKEVRGCNKNCREECQLQSDLVGHAAV
jgi:hypothetical protein